MHDSSSCSGCDALSAVLREWSAAYPRMSIRARPGSKVMFDARGGYPSEQERAKGTLTMRGLYTVEKTTIHGFSSTVRLVGLPGEWNTVMFSEPPTDGVPGTHADDELHQTLCDALSGWRYIRETHGDLYGVGWDRVERRLDAQIAASADRIKRAANGTPVYTFAPGAKENSNV